MHIADAQIHLWTNNLAPQRHRKAPLSIEGALREMGAAGVQTAVVHPPNWDPNSNAYAVQAALAHPSRFATLGWFPLDETRSEDSVERLMAMPGMKGMRVPFQWGCLFYRSISTSSAHCHPLPAHAPFD
ncbi:hypothetical protein PDO_4994 [Rhizobium sp. PDO1-076]|uniref:hypothetical protein n=1 Tax=Rhizobium sp. PDO1-076 TaxID=1125979 RepID=UPI00024E2594|nr:hypothetical protein [Rhizobium sp. PDO1-076]EHS51873.1 hypothetical protein PDO_4994 [Rhizobium sp. PDO1-076]